MPLTLHAQIPFPEQADTEEPLDIVLPRRENAQLYDALAHLADGKTQKVTAKGGITVTVEEIANYPGVHEQMNAVLRAKDMIKVTRRGAELLLTDFEPKPEIAEKGAESMADVIASMQDAKNPPRAPTGDTVVGMNTGDTKPIPLAKPGAPAPRKLSQDDWAKLRGEKPTDTHSAAEQALKRLRERR